MCFGGWFSHRRQANRSALLTYGAAIFAVFLVTLLRMSLDPVLKDQLPYALYAIAIVFAAGFGGLGPALVAALLSGAVAQFLFVEPRYVLTLPTPAHLIVWLMLVAVGLLATQISQLQAAPDYPLDSHDHLMRLQRNARARKSLSETERRFLMLTESVPALIWMTGPAGQFTYLNRQWLDFTGHSFEQLETRGWTHCIHPDDIGRFMEVYTQAVKKLEEFKVDCRLHTGEDEYCWVVAHGRPHLSPQGTFEGYIGSAIEIDDRKQDEMRNDFLLKFLSAMSRALTPKEVADVIIGQGLLALDGHAGIVALCDEERKYLKGVNRRGVPDELLDLFRVLPIEANAPICDAVRTGQPVWVESLDEFAARYPTWASEVIPLTGTQATACLPLKIGKDVIGAIQISFPRPIKFSQDLRRFIMTTAFQCAQAMERARLFAAEADARKQAETANELKVRFLGMVSHELRAPLHLIMGFSDMLVTPDMVWDDEKLQDIFTILNQESQKLHELVEQLLDASQIQAGTLSIKQQEYPLSGVIEMARTQMEKFAEQHELVIDVPDDLPLVRVDPARIGQVVVNLVSNAAKYSPAGTTITVKGFQIGDTVQVNVSDEGEGIPPEQRESIFGAFHRIERDREKRIKGVGLGLAIVKGIIDAHGGRIWVQDRPANGTVISFSVPVAEEKPAER